MKPGIIDKTEVGPVNSLNCVAQTEKNTIEGIKKQQEELEKVSKKL